MYDFYNFFSYRIDVRGAGEWYVYNVINDDP